MIFHPKRLLPNRFELAGLGLLTALVVSLGNSRQFISYFGLDSAGTVVRHTATSATATGLSRLDGLSATRTIVSFGIWALAGLFSLSVIRAIGRVYQEFLYDERVSSNRYVHPGMFKRTTFWRHVAIDLLGLVSYLSLLAILSYCFFLFILPIGLTYTRHFLLDISVLRAPEFLLGVFILFCGITALFFNLKLLINRRQVFSHS